MHHNGFKIQPIEGRSWTKVVYRAWKPNIRMCGVAEMNYEKLSIYLTELFESHEEAWEQHTGRPPPVPTYMGS